MIDVQAWDEETLERRVGLLRLVVWFLLALGVAGAAGVLGTVIVVLAVLSMIVLHEAGHFVAAKLSNMKVTEFFVGFGQRLWSVRKGETEYGVKAWPLGGYVKIPGMTNLEEVDPADEPRCYRQQSFPKRFLVVFAGPVTHFVLAFLLLVGLHVGPGVYGSEPLLEIGQISRLENGPSPAQQAGLRVGDRILAVDGQPLRRWDDLPPYIRSHPGVPVTLTIERDGARRDVRAVPVDLTTVAVEGGPPAPALEANRVGFLGVGPAFPIERAGILTAVPRASQDLGRVVGLTVTAMGQLFSLSGFEAYFDQLTARGGEAASGEPAPRLLTPVGLVRVAGAAADEGLRTALMLLIAINVFVGMVNLVPLLPLDGGHLAIALYERIRSRRGVRYHADVAKLMPVFYLTIAILGFLAITSLYLDLFKPLSLQ